MACDPQELASRSSCFFCLPAGYYYPLKLAILARWLQSVSPGANTSVAALLADASAGCIACPPGAQLGPIRLALICDATGGPVIPPDTPTDFNIEITSTIGSIDLSWTETGAPDFIQIWASVNGGAYGLVNTIAGGILAYSDTTAYAIGDLVDYKIRAHNTAGGDSAFTAVRGALIERTEGAVIGAISYPTVQAIVTDYLNTNHAGVTSISFPALQFFVGTFFIFNDATLTSISMPLLFTADAIIVDTCPALTTLTLTMLATVTSAVDLENCAALVSLALPALVSSVTLKAIGNGSLTSISAPILAHLTGGALDVETNAVLPTISLPALIDADVVMVTACASLTTISLPVLAHVTSLVSIDTVPLLTSVNLASLIDVGDFNLSAPLLATLSLPALTTDSNGMQIVGASLTSFSAANLTTISGGVGITCAALTALNLSALTITSTFNLNSCSVLATLSLPALVQINGSDFGTNACPSLTTISMPVLTAIAGNVNCAGNGAIANVSVPNWVITDVTTVDFSGNALTVASVEAILARGVASGITACTIDFTGGTNAGFAALSPAGQADFLTLTGAGNTVNINP